MDDRHQIKSIVELRKVIVTSHYQDNSLVDGLYGFVDENLFQATILPFSTADGSGM